MNCIEFVSLIELMAFLGHNLAFRADLASRENYLSTAERRDSALRIAEFLGYTPTRNVVASGYLKIDSVKTNENVFDAGGQSLATNSVQFDDSTDPNSYHYFLTSEGADRRREFIIIIIIIIMITVIIIIIIIIIIVIISISTQ